MRYFLTILMLITSCGNDADDFIKKRLEPRQKDPRTIKDVNPIFNPYYELFETD